MMRSYGISMRCRAIRVRGGRCREHRHERGVRVADGVVSVLTVRPRCLVVVPTVTSWGTA